MMMTPNMSFCISTGWVLVWIEPTLFPLLFLLHGIIIGTGLVGTNGIHERKKELYLYIYITYNLVVFVFIY